MSGLVESSADARSKTIGGNFRVRAWVRFNASGGINRAMNVSSVDHNATGEFTINFTTQMEDASYSVVGMSVDDRFMTINGTTNPTDSAVKIQTTHYNGNRYNEARNNIIVCS